MIENVAKQGGLQSFFSAGARVHEPGCQGCIGMGQAPGTGEVSLRTFPRNFPGRSGTKDDKVYLCSPETATAAALKGVITDPRDLAKEMAYPRIEEPAKHYHRREVDRFPIGRTEKDRDRSRAEHQTPAEFWNRCRIRLIAEVVLKVGDNISTDAIMPAGNQVLPLRSNIEAISEFVYSQVDPGLCKGMPGPWARWSSSGARTTARDRAASMRRLRRGIWEYARRS